MNKYRAVRTEVDGIWFASAKEALRYRELKIMEKVGAISLLVLQPRYPCIVNDRVICTYVADFQYRDKKGAMVLEDVKGFKTPEYRLKKKLIKALWGIDIVEV